jgi:MFS family permease
MVDTSWRGAYNFILFIELLKGFSSGLISSSAIAIVADISPPGCEATAQGLYSGMYSGLAMAVGGLISGSYLQIFYQSENQIKKKSPSLSDDDLKSEFERQQANDIQNMFLIVCIMTTLITIGLGAKYIFKDRVMGIPGFPRRASLH